MSMRSRALPFSDWEIGLREHVWKGDPRYHRAMRLQRERKRQQEVDRLRAHSSSKTQGLSSGSCEVEECFWDEDEKDRRAREKKRKQLELERAKPSDSDVESSESKPKPKRRRLAIDDPMRKIPYKPRKKTGVLKMLLDMPFDILCEVFGHLNPRDLLTLTRTSKPLRAMLLNRRTAISVWRQVLRRVRVSLGLELGHVWDGEYQREAGYGNVSDSDVTSIPSGVEEEAPIILPECPEDMSEPAFVDLVFGRTCHSCSKHLPGRTIIYIDYRLRVKMCAYCLLSDLEIPDTDEEDVPTPTFIGHSEKATDYEDLMQTITFNILGLSWYERQFARATEEKGGMAMGLGIEKYKRFPKEVFAQRPVVLLRRNDDGWNHVVAAGHDERWMREYNALNTAEEKDEWVERTVREQKVLNEFHNNCVEWLEEYNREQTRIKKRERECKLARGRGRGRVLAG